MTDGPAATGLGKLRLTPARILWSVLALIAVILLLQNSQQITVQFLGFEISAPLFIIIGGSMLVGWLLGEFGSRLWRWRRGDR